MKTHKHHLVPQYLGGTDDDGIVVLTITQHAMFHFCNYQLWGNWQDKVAWKGLTKQINAKEISEELKRQRNKNASISLSGVPKSEAHKKATSVANKKAYQNPEVIERCRANRPNNKAVICIDTGETYRSISEAARVTGCHRGGIMRCLKGECKQTGGMKWKFST